MIQRKQSLFLFAAFVLMLVCLCSPLGTIESSGMEADHVVFNLWISMGNGAKSFGVSPLFACLVLASPLSLATVFMYRNRLLQARMCVVVMVLCLLWHAFMAYNVFAQFPSQGVFHCSVAACLPLLSLILCAMARRGIMADEKLVRSMDRIR